MQWDHPTVHPVMGHLPDTLGVVGQWTMGSLICPEAFMIQLKLSLVLVNNCNIYCQAQGQGQGQGQSQSQNSKVKTRP